MAQTQEAAAEVLPSTPEDRAYRDLEQEAVSTLTKYLRSDDQSPASTARARIAAASISAVTRRKQAQGAARALDYQMARDLARDKSQLEEYVRLTMPAAPIVRALPSTPQSEAT
jgi:hypothetical protein